LILYLSADCKSLLLLYACERLFVFYVSWASEVLLICLDLGLYVEIECYLIWFSGF
jgi:hypothetical protein